MAKFRDVTKDPMSAEEEALRHPAEKWVFAASVAVNLLLMAAAVLFVIYGPELAANYSFVQAHSGKIRALAIVVLSGPLLVTFLRYTRRSYIRGNSVELSDEQVPFIFELLKRHVNKLGLREMPELYLSDRTISRASMSYSTWSEDYIVLATGYLDPKVENSEETIAFMLGSELGRLRLG